MQNFALLLNDKLFILRNIDGDEKANGASAPYPSEHRNYAPKLRAASTAAVAEAKQSSLQCLSHAWSAKRVKIKYQCPQLETPNVLEILQKSP